jgi:hypothetical protein
MKPPARIAVVAVVTLALLVASGCSAFPSKSSASPSPSPSAKPTRSPVTSPSRLGAVVPMPAAFPKDFPVYPGARLTQAANFGSNGATVWGMEWQTLVGTSKVQTFFVRALDAGDWVLLTYSGTRNTAFAATFKRRSNANVTGTLGVAVSAKITKISLVLTVG